MRGRCAEGVAEPGAAAVSAALGAATSRHAVYWPRSEPPSRSTGADALERIVLSVVKQHDRADGRAMATAGILLGDG